MPRLPNVPCPRRPPGFLMARRWLAGALATCCATVVLGAPAPAPPSRFGVDAPELARLGEHGVGVRTLRLVQSAQPAVLAYDTVHGTAPLRDRVLVVDVWYPAETPAELRRVTYQGELPGEALGTLVPFTVPGLAVRDARPSGGRYPLVILSHGHSSSPAAMTWLTENLASKGYVVAGIHHADPAINDPNGFPEPLLRRPLDIAYVAAELQRTLAAERLIDPSRTALIGYSMGGYGVLTAGGASIDPKGPVGGLIPGGLMAPYLRGGAQQSALTVSGVRAVVAMSALTGGKVAVWGDEGMKALTAPLLVIVGDDDRTTGYAGSRAVYDAATNAQRYLLTFKGAGHNIGLNPAPESMRQRLWDQDWFEDPVWRKDRITAINAHFITAFLDLYVKGDASRAAYLSVVDTNSAAGAWPASRHDAYDAFSPGSGEVTVWKGFQRNHASGLDLLQAAPSATR